MSPATALPRGELSAGRLAALMNAPSIVCLAEKNGKSVPNSSLCSTRYSIALTSAW